jgi:hypothetical protein
VDYPACRSSEGLEGEQGEGLECEQGEGLECEQGQEGPGREVYDLMRKFPSESRGLRLRSSLGRWSFRNSGLVRAGANTSVAELAWWPEAN